MDEFEIIHRFFTWPSRQEGTLLGVGDDAALLKVESGLAAATDTLVEGVHFLPSSPPESIGHRALAVNLSDLAAVGASPRWALLALTLPRPDEDFLCRFREGLWKLAERYGVDLVGGDTTEGEALVVTVTALGEVPPGEPLLRRGARPGDLVCVTGTLGDSALGLKMVLGELPWRCEAPIRRHLFPEPEVEVGLKLRGVATACIDLSDGLLADLGHLLEASGVGATLRWEWLPLSPPVRRYVEESGDWLLPLSGGEDFRLCFTLPPERKIVLKNLRFWVIGTIEAHPGLWIEKEGKRIALEPLGYRHFQNDPSE